MKIIKTSNYKNIESAFEGRVYSPAHESEWVRKNVEQQRPSIVPLNKKIQPKNKNRPRFRPSVVDKVPNYSLPTAQQDELSRDQRFEEGMKERKEKEEQQKRIKERQKQRVLVVEEWMTSVKGEKVRGKLYDYYSKARRQGPRGDGVINTLYNAKLGNERSLKAISDIIGEEIIIEPMGSF